VKIRVIRGQVEEVLKFVNAKVRKWGSLVGVHGFSVSWYLNTNLAVRLILLQKQYHSKYSLVYLVSAD
jgi:hypothetical protein